MSHRMVKRALLQILIAVLVLNTSIVAGTHSVSAAGSGTSYDSRYLLISPGKGVSFSRVYDVVKKLGGMVDDYIPGIGVYKVYVPSGKASQRTLETLKKELGASFVEPEKPVMLLDTTPNDPGFVHQWALGKARFPRAWDFTTGSSEVVVAVVDTGVDLNHPDLKAHLTPPSTWYDYGSGDSNPTDTFGHGTHCAGIVAAVGNNGVGVTGASWNVRIMPIKVFPDNVGSTNTSLIAKGIVHAVDYGADIISLSIGSSSPSHALESAIQYAYQHKVLVVAAVGNRNSEAQFYPAAYPHVLSVAAVDQNDKKASFSNYGTWVDVSAPGVHIFSTMPTYHVKMNDYGYVQNYDYMSGTSMAAPLVAGIAALIKSMHPEWGPDRIAQVLEGTADKIDDLNPGYEGKLGTGRIDAAAAVELAAGETDPSPTLTSTPTIAPTPTLTPTPTPTLTPTATPWIRPTPTATSRPTIAPSPTVRPTRTPMPAVTPTRVIAPTATPLPRPTPTNTPTPRRSGGVIPFLPIIPTSIAKGTRPTPTVPRTTPSPEKSHVPTMTPTVTSTITPTLTLTPTPKHSVGQREKTKDPLPFWLWNLFSGPLGG